MSITVTCPECGKKLKAKESLIGKSAPCPNCGQKVLVTPAEEEATAYLLKPDEPVQPPPTLPAEQDEGVYQPEESPTGPPKPRKKKRSFVSLPPITSNDPPPWLRHFHWLLVLAMVPLALSLLKSESEKDDILQRLERTLSTAPKDVRNKIERVMSELDQGRGSLDDLFGALPGQRFEGALLPRRSWMHWAFAGAASIVFMAFFLVLTADHVAEAKYLLGAGLFTATIGILFLLLVQLFAGWSQGLWITGRSIIVLVFLVVKLIGFSYQAALDPENGFLLSFIGFTLGVGFCEEVCKALPLFWFSQRSSNPGWRSLFLWGLASGAGFGISEGIMYASNFYNGISGANTYIVRFISCVALHAVWTGSVAVTLYQSRSLFDQVSTWYEYIPPLFFIAGIPMILHGLYDTLLKKEMSAAALVVAVLSFLYLAFQISRRNVVDDAARNKAMLRDYKRRREAMS